MNNSENAKPLRDTETTEESKLVECEKPEEAKGGEGDIEADKRYREGVRETVESRGFDKDSEKN